MFPSTLLLWPVLAVAGALLLLSVRIAQEYQRAVVFRLGRLVGARGPGLYLLIPLVERAVTVDLRTITQQLETQETVTRDGVVVRVNAVLWYQARDPRRAVVEVQDWRSAVKQAAETAMRDAIGQNDLDGLLKDRPHANRVLRETLSGAVARWGIEVAAVELKDLDIPETMQRAIAREAEAVREKRARIIKAEGEQEASAKLAEAARTIAGSPGALELRRLQTLAEIGAEHNSTIVVALPESIAGTATGSIALARSTGGAAPR